METEFLLANVQPKNNPQQSQMFVVATNDLCSFISGVSSENVVVFTKVKFYDSGKQK